MKHARRRIGRKELRFYVQKDLTANQRSSSFNAYVWVWRTQGPWQTLCRSLFALTDMFYSGSDEAIAGGTEVFLIISTEPLPCLRFLPIPPSAYTNRRKVLLLASLAFLMTQNRNQKRDLPYLPNLTSGTLVEQPQSQKLTPEKAQGIK